MENNYKYLTSNFDDREWGLYLMVAGSARIEPDSSYPPTGHPSGYNFNWEHGRVLNEYQINYITHGEGIMETRDNKYNIKAGSVILLRPDMWHRYHPLKETGWIENYIGFKGEIAERMINSSDVLKNLTVLQIGFHEEVLHNFIEIINEAMNERPGYHQVCSGLVINLLGQVISIVKSKSFRHSSIEDTIKKACVLIRQNMDKNININDLSGDLGIDYTTFRKAFKKYTGLSPMQYHMSLRIKLAAHMLNNTDLTCKEISTKLGFSSQYYFSKLFKVKMNKTPQKYRERNGEIIISGTTNH